MVEVWSTTIQNLSSYAFYFWFKILFIIFFQTISDLYTADNVYFAPILHNTIYFPVL